MAAAVIGLYAGADARAQTSPQALGVLEEIVVTAQKRSESLQRVPVSVTVLTTSQLAATKLDTPSDFAALIPNLQVDTVNGDGSPLFSLRGVSMFDYSLNQSSPVASYVDEVYKGNLALFGVELYDLERVEVLRGPQGTLYGKNSTGGAINFITRKPSFDTEAGITLGVGNYSRQEAEGTLQGTVIPGKLAVRAAFTYSKVHGFIENILPGHPDMQGVNQYGARLSLLYKASDSLDLTVRYSKSMQDPQNFVTIAGSIATSPPYGPGIGGTGYFRTIDGTQTGVPLRLDQVAQNYTPRRRQDNEAVELTVDWKLSDALAVTSITSWDRGSLFIPDPGDGAPIDVLKAAYNGKTRQVTQDLRLTSSTGGPFEYIVGAYYQHETIFDSTENQVLNFLDLNGDGAINYQDCADASFNFGFAGLGYSNGLPLNPACRYYNSFDQIRNSWSAYSDASYQVTPLVKLRAGIRYNHDNGTQKNALNQLRGPDEVAIANLGFFSLQPDGTFAPTLALPGSPNYDAIVGQTRQQSLHNTAVTGRAGVDVTPTKDALIYLNYSRGYRSAAFNGQFLFTPSDFTQVNPEVIDAYELGFKTAWLGHRLELNGAVFHYQYKNQQFIDVRPTGQQPLINLGKSKIDGGEIELVSRPVQSLTLRAGLGFLDGKVQKGALADGTVNVAGQRLPHAPSVSGTVSADWDPLTLSHARLTLHIDGSYVSKQYFELLNQDRIAQDPYGLINGRIGFHGADDRWDIGVWGRNLANKFYFTSQADLQGLGFDYRHRGAPRMFGLDASYHF